jgi:hypothetical protein
MLIRCIDGLGSLWYHMSKLIIPQSNAFGVQQLFGFLYSECRDHKKSSRLTSKVLTGYLSQVSVVLYH